MLRNKVWFAASVAAIFFSLNFSGCGQSAFSSNTREHVRIPPFVARTRYAWVTIFYETGPRDEEYFRGARVALNSMKTHGSTYDRVVLVTNDISHHYLSGFIEDGVLVKILPNNVASNFSHAQR